MNVNDADIDIAIDDNIAKIKMLIDRLLDTHVSAHTSDLIRLHTKLDDIYAYVRTRKHRIKLLLKLKTRNADKSAIELMRELNANEPGLAFDALQAKLATLTGLETRIDKRANTRTTKPKKDA